MISSQKKFQPNQSFLRPPEFPPKFGSDPFKGEKKIAQIMGFMVFKSTGLDSQFQRKNRFWKICTESRDITKKVSEIGLPNQTSKIWHILADISGLGAYFSKPIFALKPWDWARRFEYHEPYNLNNFFFFSLIKGFEKFWGSHPPSLKNSKSKKSRFSCLYIP